MLQLPPPPAAKYRALSRVKTQLFIMASFPASYLFTTLAMQAFPSLFSSNTSYKYNMKPNFSTISHKPKEAVGLDGQVLGQGGTILDKSRKSNRTSRNSIGVAWAII